MTLGTVVLLFSAGIVGGLINALAGGATLITFPAMLSVGLPAIAANASNAVAISPGHLIAVVADRGKLPPLTARLVTFMAVATLGGAVGACVLLVLPERLFTLPVPALIAFATGLFALAPRIQSWAGRNGGAAQSSSTTISAAFLAAASVYGGFFGAGLGVILTAALAITEPNDIRATKALKNLLATCVALAAMVIFIARGVVQWHETIVMLAGTAMGGYGGGFLIRVLPAIWVRWFVIVAGAAMTIIYAIQYWF
jgi:uncharacterized membrane protein YfcA